MTKDKFLPVSLSGVEDANGSDAHGSSVDGLINKGFEVGSVACNLVRGRGAPAVSTYPTGGSSSGQFLHSCSIWGG
jgi:hypothetical protein